MQRTQVYLTAAQDQGLKRLARRTGRRQSELIREAVDRLLAEPPGEDWKAGWRQAYGIWADRDDVDAIMRQGRERLQSRAERLAKQWQEC